MKNWPLLLMLPLGIGATICSRSFVHARETVPPPIESQAELDDVARQNPSTDFDKLGHAFANSQARLFWNTNLEAAKRQSAREGKPILALKMLGNLSDEYSCANSRFFRVVFYPQSQINEKLRRDFVLLWSSERPVPVMTIDMGDGRILKRTITGNSAHYLLDSNGRPLDVFPGLATPAAFDSWLASSSRLALDFKAQPPTAQNAWLAQWHKEHLRETLKARSERNTEERALELQMQQIIDNNPLEANAVVASVPARVAAPRAFGKKLAEGPLLKSFDTQNIDIKPLDEAVLPMPEPGAPPILDQETRERIRDMNPLATQPQKSQPPVQTARPSAQNVNLQQSQIQLAPANRGDGFENLIRRFEAALRVDTRQNQDFSMSIHALFANRHEGNWEALNRRVYDRLFLTPRSDAWLGLTADGAFTALQNDGVVPTKQTDAGLSTN